MFVFRKLMQAVKNQNPIYMNKLLLFFFFMFFLSSYSQSKESDFTIVKIGDKYSKEVLTNAFKKADMCGHYYYSKPNDIVFDDGSIVRLPSKKDMSNVSAMTDSCFMYDDAKPGNFFWSITTSGHIAKGVALAPNKSYLNN